MAKCCAITADIFVQALWPQKIFLMVVLQKSNATDASSGILSFSAATTFHYAPPRHQCIQENETNII